MSSFNSILIETQYLPSIEFFCCIHPYDEIVIEDFEHFQKQTYRNRCYILGANNVLTLTVPVIKGNSKTLINKLEIDYSHPWHKEHWRSIQSAYGKAPFFEYYEPYFKKVYTSPPKYLAEFNFTLLTICLKLLQWKTKVSKTTEYQNLPKNGTIDARSVIIPKVDFKERSYFKPFEYMQVFGKDFVANLSIIDLLMNEGPNARNIVTNSILTE